VSARSRIPAVVLLALATGASAYGLARALANRVPLRAVQGTLLWVEVAALAAAVAVGALAFRRQLARDPPRAPCLRSLFVLLVAAWILFLALVQPFQRLWFDLALGFAAGAWSALSLAEDRLARLPRILRRTTGPALVVLAASFVLLEVSLRLVASLRPSPLLVRVGDAPRRTLERFRCKPGELRFGFPFNRGGHYDGEFGRKRPGERLVASIGDSFSVSAVPHAQHFTTVCEQALGATVANLGAPGIGPPEYLRLLVDEAMPLDPDAVVVCVFVGNDLSYADVEKDLPDPFLRGFLQRDSVLAWVLPGRLVRIARERDRAVVSPEKAESSLPAADPLLEEPSMSAEAFLRLETQRAREVCAIDPASLESFRDAMRSMKAAAGSARLVVMLIPDEFQVEDSLWDAVVAAAGTDLARDRPQALVRSLLEEEAIPCLDLLPALRAAPPLADGRRHVYHARDTHWNARGNRIAGAELAKFLAPRLN